MIKLFAYLSYHEVDAGIEWLTTIGFETTATQQDEDGRVIHAELRLGAAVVMVAPADEEYDVPQLIGRSTGNGLYLLVEDVSEVHRAAVEAGGTSVFEPETTEWGTERSRVLDPEGHEWSFGTYDPSSS
jgi:uncharacterized glyoxalase superfamily protein PhnB